MVIKKVNLGGSNFVS